jgi:hypothetical protein
MVGKPPLTNHLPGQGKKKAKKHASRPPFGKPLARRKLLLRLLSLGLADLGAELVIVFRYHIFYST